MKEVIDRIIHAGLAVAFSHDQPAADAFVREATAEIKREMAAYRDRAHFKHVAAYDSCLEIIRLKCLLPRFVWEIDYWTDLGAKEFRVPTYAVSDTGHGADAYHRSTLEAELQVVLDFLVADQNWMSFPIFMDAWKEKIAEWEPDSVAIQVRGPIDPMTNHSWDQADVNVKMRTIFANYLISNNHNETIRKMIFGRL